MPVPPVTTIIPIPNVCTVNRVVPNGPSLRAAVLSYTLPGPTTGVVGTASSFTVTPNDLVASDSVSLSDGGAGGVLLPTSVSFSNTSTPQGFTYTPSAPGTVVLSGTSGHGYPVSPSSISVSPITYNLTGPSSGYVLNNYTLTVTPNTVIVSDTVTLSDGAGGTFVPPTLTFTSSSAPQTTTYTPASAGSLTLTATSGHGYVGGSLGFASTALSYALSGTTTGLVIGNWYGFTLAPDATIPADTVTLSDGGAGGAFWPSSLTFTNSSATQSFRYMPGPSGAVTLGGTSTHGYAVTAPATFTPAPAPAVGIVPATLPTGVPAAYIDATGSLLYFLAETVAVGSGASASAIILGGSLVGFTNIVGGSGYQGATVTISGDGTGATATAYPAQGGIMGYVITNPGSGYTTATVTVSGNATATTSIVGRQVIAITPLTGGSGYCSVYLSGGGGTGAAAIPIIVGGVITGFTIINPGRGYTSAPTVTIYGGGPATITGVGAMADGSNVLLVTKNGVPLVLPLSVSSITVSPHGSGYTSPTVTITAAGGDPGVGARGVATTGAGNSITAISVNNPASAGQFSGGGYLVPPTVAISGGGGSGAVAIANLGPVWTNFNLGEPWVAYPLPSPASPSDVFTFTAPNGWLSATPGGSTGYMINAPIQNYASPGAVGHSAREPAPNGWGLVGFGTNLGTMQLGMDVGGPNASFAGPEYLLQNWITRSPFGWANAFEGRVPALVTDSGGNPTQIVGGGTAYARLIAWSGAGESTQGLPMAPGIYTVIADEGSPLTPMTVVLENDIGNNWNVVPVPGTPIGTTAGKTWQWTVSCVSPLRSTVLPYLVVKVTTHSGSAGPWTLSNMKFLPPQSFAPAGVGAVVVNGFGGNYTSPVVSFSGGGGTGAAATANLVNGGIVSIPVASSSSDFSAAPNITIDAPGGGGTQAQAYAVVSFATNGKGPVTSIVLTDCGSGYSSLSPPTVHWSAVSGGTTLTFGTLTITNGVIRTITVTNPGTGYTAPPTVAISDSTGSGTAVFATLNSPAQTSIDGDHATPDPNWMAMLRTPSGKNPAWIRAHDAVASYDGESNIVDAADLKALTDFSWGTYPTVATALAYSSGGVLSLVLANGAGGYATVPTVVITPAAGETGTGATFTATMVSGSVTGFSGPSGTGYLDQPVASFSGGGSPTTAAVAFGIVSGGTIIGFIITNRGAGYSSPPTVTISDPTLAGSGASATAVLGTGATAGQVVCFQNIVGGSGYHDSALVSLVGGVDRSTSYTFAVAGVRPYLPGSGSPNKVFISDNWPGTLASGGGDPLPYYFPCTSSSYLSVFSTSASYAAEAVTVGPHGLKTGWTVSLSSPTPVFIQVVNGGGTVTVNIASLTFGVFVTGPNTFAFNSVPGNIAAGYPMANVAAYEGTSGLTGSVGVPDNGTIPFDAWAGTANMPANIVVTLPVGTTLACANTIAQQTLSKVPPNVLVGVEYLNEHWDLTFTRGLQLFGYAALNNQTLDQAFTQRTADIQYVFWQVFNAAGRGHQIVNLFGSRWGGPTTADIIAYANANTVTGTSIPIRVDAIMLAPYPSCPGDGPICAAAAALATGDPRSAMYGGTPWTRPMMASLVRHHLKYGLFELGVWAVQAAAVAAYTGPAGIYGAKPALWCYENALTRYIPEGIQGVGGTVPSSRVTLRSQLTGDMRYEPAVYGQESALYEQTQDGGASVCIVEILCGAAASTTEWDGQFALGYTVYEWFGQPWGYGDGSDGKAVNQFTIPGGAQGYAFQNVSVKGQAWRDWADVANAPSPRTNSPTRRWFPGLKRLTVAQRTWAESHRPVAIAVARRYFRPAIMSMQETVSASYMGLVKAALDYDPSLGNMPTTFIWTCCRCEIMNRIREVSGYKSKNRTHPISFTDYLFRTSRPDSDEPHSTLAIAVPDDDLFDDRPALMHAAIGELREPYATVIRLYLEDMSMADIGRRIGYTREGVRQVKKRAIDHLRSLVRRAT